LNRGVIARDPVGCLSTVEDFSLGWHINLKP
jgi:hypothetical protein